MWPFLIDPVVMGFVSEQLIQFAQLVCSNLGSSDATGSLELVPALSR